MDAADGALIGADLLFAFSHILRLLFACLAACLADSSASFNWKRSAVGARKGLTVSAKVAEVVLLWPGEVTRGKRRSVGEPVALIFAVDRAERVR